jgi:hypothetical protein
MSLDDPTVFAAAVAMQQVEHGVTQHAGFVTIRKVNGVGIVYSRLESRSHSYNINP